VSLIPADDLEPLPAFEAEEPARRGTRPGGRGGRAMSCVARERGGRRSASVAEQTQPRRRCTGADPADADLMRRTAAWLRADPDRARDVVGPDVRALAALLDLLAAELPHVAAGVRRQAVESCRRVLDEAG
jgi:hypothetical protein